MDVAAELLLDIFLDDAVLDQTVEGPCPV
jgi:hypothetical protein